MAINRSGSQKAAGHSRRLQEEVVFHLNVGVLLLQSHLQQEM